MNYTPTQWHQKVIWKAKIETLSIGAGKQSERKLFRFIIVRGLTESQPMFNGIG